MTTALMIVDVQKGMFDRPTPLWQPDATVERIAGVLARARAAGTPVFHVQHDGGPGHPLAKGSAGWPHHPRVAPLAGETVIEKRASSAFHGTDLHDRLKALGIDRLVVAGAQTEMCVDSACRAAVALDYRVVLVADGHTTYDTDVIPAERIVAHHNRLLGKVFVELKTAADVTFD